MGGCCCSAKGPELTIPSGYNYVREHHPLQLQCSRTLEEQVPLRALHGATTAPSQGLLVDTNLDTSTPDTYRSPPAPLPYNVVLGHPLTPIRVEKATGSKSDEMSKTANCGSNGEAAADDNNPHDNSVKCVDLKLSNCKEQSDFDIKKEKELEINSLKSAEPLVSAEECPTCLEEYDADNPKFITKCDHHFHLACILEWLERSDTCPVCNQELILDPPVS